jgi:hypothetical protein
MISGLMRVLLVMLSTISLINLDQNSASGLSIYNRFMKKPYKVMQFFKQLTLLSFQSPILTNFKPYLMAFLTIRVVLFAE